MLENVSRRQVIGGLVGLGVGSLIPNFVLAKPKKGMSPLKTVFELKKTKVNIQLTILKSDNPDCAQVYYCKRQYKKETQPLYLLNIPYSYTWDFHSGVTINQDARKELKQYLEDSLEHGCLKGNWMDNTHFVLFKGPEGRVGIWSFDKGYIKYNEDEYIKRYHNYDFSTEL